MDNSKCALALWRLYEQLSEDGFLDEFPVEYIDPGEIKVDNHRIVFPNGARVELTAMECAIYRLFLRHPSGIRLDARWQHYSELLKIYGRESESSDTDWKERRIDDLCEDDSAHFSSHIVRGRFRPFFLAHLPHPTQAPGRPEPRGCGTILHQETCRWDLPNRRLEAIGKGYSHST